MRRLVPPLLLLLLPHRCPRRRIVCVPLRSRLPPAVPSSFLFTSHLSGWPLLSSSRQLLLSPPLSPPPATTDVVMMINITSIVFFWPPPTHPSPTTQALHPPSALSCQRSFPVSAPSFGAAQGHRRRRSLHSKPDPTAGTTTATSCHSTGVPTARGTPSISCSGTTQGLLRRAGTTASLLTHCRNRHGSSRSR